MQDLRCCPRGVLSLYLSLNFGICWFDVWFYVVYVFNLLNLLECDRKLWNVFVLCCGLIFVLICVLMVKRNLVFNFVIRFRVVRCMVLWPIRLLRSRICVQLHQWWIFLFILVTYLLVAQAILEIRREEGRIFFPPWNVLDRWPSELWFCLFHLLLRWFLICLITNLNIFCALLNSDNLIMNNYGKRRIESPV